MYADLLAPCEASGLAPTIAAEVGTMLTNILLVAAGVGVSVVPISMRDVQSGAWSVRLRASGTRPRHPDFSGAENPAPESSPSTP